MVRGGTGAESPGRPQDLEERGLESLTLSASVFTVDR